MTWIPLRESCPAILVLTDCEIIDFAAGLSTSNQCAIVYHEHALELRPCVLKTYKYEVPVSVFNIPPASATSRTWSTVHDCVSVEATFQQRTPGHLSNRSHTYGNPASRRRRPLCRCQGVVYIIVHKDADNHHSRVLIYRPTIRTDTASPPIPPFPSLHLWGA